MPLLRAAATTTMMASRSAFSLKRTTLRSVSSFTTNSCLYSASRMQHSLTTASTTIRSPSSFSTTFHSSSLRLLQSRASFATTTSSSSSPLSSSPSSPLDQVDAFSHRHIGPSDADIQAMCDSLNVKDLDHLTSLALPASIKIKNPTRLGKPLSENETLSRLKFIAQQNQIFKSYIGMGYASAITPPVILRNIMENPAWYTQVNITMCVL
ncbi:glycine cleavage system P-protein-domain-containing protein [Chytridium lagenaria]|nr:glycine cleavage system P-protein-domain-containing protein [Chytridium lagenaria]